MRRRAGLTGLADSEHRGIWMDLEFPRGAGGADGSTVDRLKSEDNVNDGSSLKADLSAADSIFI